MIWHFCLLEGGAVHLYLICPSLCPFQMYSEGSEYLHQNNETALQYFKKASDLVSTHAAMLI